MGIVSIVRNGYFIELSRPHPLTGVWKTSMRSHTRNVMDGEVGNLREKGAIVPVPSGQEGLGFYSTYFSVPKKDGG